MTYPSRVEVPRHCEHGRLIEAYRCAGCPEAAEGTTPAEWEHHIDDGTECTEVVVSENRLYRTLAESNYPVEVLSIIRTLAATRARYVLGRALAARYPDDVEFDESLNSADVLEAVAELVQVVGDVQLDNVEAGKDLTATPEEVTASLERHEHRALEAVQNFAALLQVPPSVLVAALMG